MKVLNLYYNYICTFILSTNLAHLVYLDTFDDEADFIDFTLGTFRGGSSMSPNLGVYKFRNRSTLGGSYFNLIWVACVFFKDSI